MASCSCFGGVGDADDVGVVSVREPDVANGVNDEIVGTGKVEVKVVVDEPLSLEGLGVYTGKTSMLLLSIGQSGVLAVSGVVDIAVLRVVDTTSGLVQRWVVMTFSALGGSWLRSRVMLDMFPGGPSCWAKSLFNTGTKTGAS